MDKDEKNEDNIINIPKSNPMSQIDSPKMPTKEERDNGGRAYEVRGEKNGRQTRRQ